MQGKKISALFYCLAGKLDEKLAQEEEQFFNAQREYDIADSQLANIQIRLEQCAREQAALADCEAQYTMVRQQKIMAIKAMKGNLGEKISNLEERVNSLTDQEKRLEQAENAGQTALGKMEQVLWNLNEAKELSDWILFSDCMFVDLEKDAHLKKAQEMLEEIQADLQLLKNELKDNVGEINSQVRENSSVSDLNFFGEVFWGNVMSGQIQQVQQKVLQIKTQITEALEYIKVMQEQTKNEEIELQVKIEDCLSTVPM